MRDGDGWNGCSRHKRLSVDEVYPGWPMGELWLTEFSCARQPMKGRSRVLSMPHVRKSSTWS